MDETQRRHGKGSQEKGAKPKRNLSLIVVTDNGRGEIRKTFVGAGKIGTFCALAALLLLILAALGCAEGVRLSLEKSRNEQQTQRIARLTEEMQQLEVENAELDGKVVLLSEAVNRLATQESQEAEKHIPRGLPVSGTAAVLDGAGEETGEDGLTPDQAVRFAVPGGVTVVATASGTVEELAEDAEYGRRLVLDHGNGYRTCYRVAGEPKVQVGDELTAGTLLFEVGADGAVLAYQIEKDGTYLNPLEQMEIRG